MIKAPSSLKDDEFKSKESGVLGLGPSVGDGSFKDQHNFIRQLRNAAKVKRDTISYWITWNDNVNSYIQIGDVSKRIKEKTRYQMAESFEHFGLAVT